MDGKKSVEEKENECVMIEQIFSIFLLLIERYTRGVKIRRW